MPQIDLQKILALLPFAVSAMRPGSQAATGFMQGSLQGQAALRQRQFEDEDRRRREQQDREAAFYRQQQLRLQESAEDRAQQELALQRRREALQRLAAYGERDLQQIGRIEEQPELALDETATPLSAQNDLTVRRLQQQQQLGLAGLPQGPLPNMTQAVSRRQKREAKRIYDETQKVYGDEWMADDSHRIDTGAHLWGPVRPSELRAKFMMPATLANGQPAVPTVRRPDRTLEEELSDPTTSPERRRELLRNRAAWQAAGREPPTASAAGTFEDYLRRYAAEQAKPVEMLTTTDIDTARKAYEAARAAPSGGGLGAAAVQLRNQRTAAALNSVDRLKALAPVRRPGPAGIVEGMGEVGKAYLGYSTKTRQYQALIQPAAMQMAAAIQGAANLSDNERKAMAEMLGSINRMDYESQIALLDQASQLLQNNADVIKIDGQWHARGRQPTSPAPDLPDGITVTKVSP